MKLSKKKEPKLSETASKSNKSNKSNKNKKIQIDKIDQIDQIVGSKRIRNNKNTFRKRKHRSFRQRSFKNDLQHRKVGGGFAQRANVGQELINNQIIDISEIQREIDALKERLTTVNTMQPDDILKNIEHREKYFFAEYVYVNEEGD